MNFGGKWDFMILRDSNFIYFVPLSFSSSEFHLISQDPDQPLTITSIFQPSEGKVLKKAYTFILS